MSTSLTSPLSMDLVDHFETTLDESLGPPVNLQNAICSGPFPHEIYDMIIDGVAASLKHPDDEGDHADDKEEHARLCEETLVACLLTCKQFVTRSRRHVYRHLMLGSTPNVSRLTAIYHPSRLGAWVRELTIDDVDDESTDEDRSLAPVHWLTSFIPMLSGLQNVESLAFWSLKWAALGAYTRSFILQHFPPTVKELDLRKTNLWNSNQAFRVLHSFPHLSRLILGAVTCEYPNHTRTQITAQVPLHLKELMLHDVLDEHGVNTMPAHVAQWLLAHRFPFGLRKLNLLWSHSNSGTLVALLRKMLPPLEELRLTINIGEWGQDLWENENDPESYALDDDVFSDGDDEVPGGDDSNIPTRHEQWLGQLETEANYWIDEYDAWELLVDKLQESPAMHAPNLQRAIISFHMPWDVSEVTPFLDWISAISPPGMFLDLTMNMKDAGIDYMNLYDIDEGVPRHLDIWRRSSSRVIFRIQWPTCAHYNEVEGLPWLEWLGGQWPRLQELGLPFEGRSARVELLGSSEESACGPLTWIVNDG
ncbi:hypothetical protein OBBRIDRAFT_797668 [Obba rivulosa]|uniref:Uncharacterized protein n=1 Tax=Obba rivulosa TaxID=1052685 RepID=A0A8E2AJW5_9APHY|nr:hypothetical protein OBBRIDRAFT_797668 [Obba rivulosa]